MSADSTMGPDRRVSRPTTYGTSVPSTCATARPSAVTSSGVSSVLAMPRMPSVPNSRVTGLRAPGRGSALRVLGCLAGLLQPVLPALLLARVAHEEARLLERGAQLVVEGHQRSRDAQAKGTGLSAHAATAEARVDVVDVGRLRESQRLGGV